MLKKHFIQSLREVSVWGWILMILGTTTWSLTMVKSGLVLSYGMGFWGPNGHDGVWHIALAQGLAGGDWEMPVFAGETIKNYHIGFDLILAVLHKLTLIPISVLYFQILPPILAFLIGIFVYLFILSWKKSKTTSFWATFFVYFGGSWGWLLSLIRDGKLDGESMFWSQQSVSTLVNPPYALSLVFLFLGLWMLFVGEKKGDKKLLTLASFLFGLLVQIKIYAGVLVIIGLFVSSLWQVIKRKRFLLTKVFLSTLVISILVFSPLDGDLEKVIVLEPFWFLESMMSFSDRVGWKNYGEAMVNYKLAGNLIKGFTAYFVAFLIFLIGNLGTRVLAVYGFLKHLKNFRNLSYIEVFCYTVILSGIIIPTFFIQKGTPWNTIQFFYYSLVFSGILAGVSLGSIYDIYGKTNFSISMIRIINALVVFLTIPTTIGTLWYHYLPGRPPAKISKEELEAHEFLKRQPEGIVLTLPFDKKLAETAVANPPRPLYLYESTAYVSAFSGKPTYLEDEVNLEITGYPWRKRRKELELFLNTTNIRDAGDFLKNNNISYIYWVKPLIGSVSGDQMLMKEIFENEEIQIFKVNQI